VLYSPIKNLQNFIRDPLHFMHTMHKNHGDYFSLYLGHKQFHFVCHPDLVEKVLNSELDAYRKSRLIFNKIKPITGHKGIVQLDGEEWDDMRRVTGDVFHRRHLDEYIHIINHYADEVLAELEREVTVNAIVDMAALTIRYTIKTAVRIFFGKSHDVDTASIAGSFIELNALCGQRMRQVISLPLLVPTRLNRKINRARAKLDVHMQALINQSGISSEFSLLAKLSVSLKDHPQKNQLIKDQVMTFLFAGYETTAASLAFTGYLLAKHPNYQQQIREDTNEMTAAVYREALRLYPPAYMLARELRYQQMLGERLLGKGDNVILSLRELHRHEQFWPNGHDFMPERFLNTESLVKHKFAYLPFGYGKRVCSGMQLAMLEADIFLKKILTHYQLSLPETSELQLEAMVTLHPGSQLNLLVNKL